MTRKLLLGVSVFWTALSSAAAADDAKVFHVVVQRLKTVDGLVIGELSVNGKKLGPCYENDDKKIPAGTYKGVVRTTSMRHHAQGPGGKMDNSGDFLLEVAGVPKRSDILFHAGNKKEHSLGCILCGPITKDPESGARLAPEPLKQLRLQFFGTDTPTGKPDKAIKIEVRDP